jgi:hypothetical protein
VRVCSWSRATYGDSPFFSDAALSEAGEIDAITLTQSTTPLAHVALLQLPPTVGSASTRSERGGGARRIAASDDLGGMSPYASAYHSTSGGAVDYAPTAAKYAPDVRADNV